MRTRTSPLFFRRLVDRRALFIGALLSLGIAQEAHALRIQSQLVQCFQTSWSGCGGDTLTAGKINLQDSGTTRVTVEGAAPFNLYEVYWLRIGQSVTDATLVGNFATDCSGDKGAALRTITRPRDVVKGTPTNIYTAVGDSSAGNFLVYSRGPWGFGDANGDCEPDTFNTAPLGTNPNATFANPAVNLAIDPVQFLSGYANP